MNDKIKSYTNNKGNELFRFQIYLGKSETTGSSMYIKKRGFKSREEAERAYKEIEKSLEQGTYQVKKEKRYKFKDMFKRWFSEYKHDVKESTYASTLRIFNNHILPVLGNCYIDKLTVDKCEQAVAIWRKEAPRTFKRYIRYANNVLNEAVRLELLKKNPMNRIHKTRIRALKENFNDFYTREELEQFLKCCKESESLKVYTFFHLLAYTGMRKGETLALTWQDVDLEGETLTIDKTLTMGLNNRLFVNDKDDPQANGTKTADSTRIIDLDPQTIRILKQWKHEQLKELFKIGINGLNKNQLIFSDAKNKHLYPSKPTQWNNRICKKYGLKHIKIHGFRHTHASLLFNAGATMKETQERLGHKDITTTMNIYTHVMKTKKKETAIKFAKYMASNNG